MIHSVLSSERGFATLIALIMLGMLTLIGIAAISTSDDEMTIAGNEMQEMRAFYAAESGINRTLQCINSTDWTGWTIAGTTYTLPLQPLDDAEGNTIAYYEVAVDMSDPEEPIAESEGYSPTQDGAKRSLWVEFERMEAAITAKGDVVLKGNGNWVDSFTEYLLATTKDMPVIESTVLEIPEASGPFGAKGVGEIVLVPTAPAVANAVYDATGVRVRQLPISPEAILKGIRGLK